jgi:hypothetical protein
VYVPDPPTRSAFRTSVVPENEVMTPSTKFEGVTTYDARVRVPTVNAVWVADRLVVNVRDPVPISVDVLLVRLA